MNGSNRLLWRGFHSQIALIALNEQQGNRPRLGPYCSEDEWMPVWYTHTQTYTQRLENTFSRPETKVSIHTHIYTDLLLPFIYVLWGVVERQKGAEKNKQIKIQAWEGCWGPCSQKEVSGNTATSVQSYSWHYLRRPSHKGGDLAGENQCFCLEGAFDNWQETDS